MSSVQEKHLLIQENFGLLEKRNHKICIADYSEVGWPTVKHYESNPLALNSATIRKSVRQRRRRFASSTAAKTNVMWTGLRVEVSSILHMRVASRDNKTTSDFSTSGRSSGSMINRRDLFFSAEMLGIGGLNVQYVLARFNPRWKFQYHSHELLSALHRRPPIMLPRGSQMFPEKFPGAWLVALSKRKWRD